MADAAVDGPYRKIDRAIYLTAAMTGLRQGELVALRWRDVDWTAGRIRVRQNYVLGEFGTPKSRRSTRSVPMADEVAGELDRLSSTVGESSGDALVFADPHTRPGRSTRRRSCGASAGRSRPRSLSSLIASTICATRSVRRWLVPAFPYGPCRRGWGIGTSRQPSATQITRRARTSGHCGGGFWVGWQQPTARLADDVTALKDA